MAIQEAIRRFGPPPGAPGIEVIERPGINQLADPRYGTVAFYGILKRGPMGVPIPVTSRKEYDEIFGDPRDARWHLFSDGSHLLPDAIDGFFNNSNGAGMVWLTRLDLDNKARKAELTLKNRMGIPVLKVLAANEGRWGGRENVIDATPVIYATSRTFTIVADKVEENEFVDAEVSFSAIAARTYKVIANTNTSETGEVIFTVGSQYDLVSDGVAGPTALAGTATYERYTTLTGTVNFPLTLAATGTVAINGQVITGTGTAFSTEFKVGSNVYFEGEARVVLSITSDTTMTISSAFSTATTTGATLSRDNLTVTGTLTTFDTDLTVGDMLYVEVNGEYQGRKIAAIDSATELTLESGWTVAQTASAIYTDNLTIVGTTTSFTTEVNAGQYIIDPNRSGKAIKIESVTSDTELVLVEQFPNDFTDAQLTKQNQYADIHLHPVINGGLSIEIGQGQRYPATHFSLTVNFNNSRVLYVPDASLDPNDEMFVEPLVNDSNVAFRTGSVNHPKWIVVESLWNSAYTTTQANDVRPANGSDIALALDQNILYTVAEMDYVASVGNSLFPNPYNQPRNFFRVKSAMAPVEVEGTVSTTGTTVNGTSTNFLDVFEVGDYFYDPTSNTARRIRLVTSNVEMQLESAFASDVAALTVAKKVGYLEVDRGYDLEKMTNIGGRFLVAYPETLKKGYDGGVDSIIPYYFTKFADIDRNHLENAVWGRNLGLIRIATPGISDITVQKAFGQYCEAKAYEYRGEIPITISSASSAESYVGQELGRSDFTVLAFPSYGYISNPLGSGDRMVSLSGDIMGGESRYSVIHEGYHHIYAGVRAKLSRIIKLPLEITPADEAIINITGIQNIKYIDGNVVVWGARMPSQSAIRDFIHIARIQNNYVRVFLEARSLLEYLFMPNQPNMAEQIVMVLNNFARREYRKGVFTQYLSFKQAVEISGGLASESNDVISEDEGRDALVSIINGKLSIYFRYVPTGILERLSLNVGPDVLVSQYGNTINASDF